MVEEVPPPSERPVPVDGGDAVVVAVRGAVVAVAVAVGVCAPTSTAPAATKSANIRASPATIESTTRVETKPLSANISFLRAY
jgi:hypothetical protein